jgi:hypothetical protein
LVTASGPTTFCIGDSVTLSAPAGFNYLWNIGANTQSIVVKIGGDYTVQTIAGTCTSAVSAITTVTINPAVLAPTITASGPTTFFEDDSVILSTTASPVLWSNGATTSSIVVKTAGTYTVTSSFGGCSATSLPVVVVVNPKPIVGNLQQVQDSVKALLIAGATYQWYFNGTIIPGATANGLKITQIGQYSVKITTANGYTITLYLDVLTTINPINSLSTFRLYPNPATTTLNIEGTTSSLYVLLNHLGQVVANGHHDGSLSVKDLAKGVYWLKVDGYKAQRFVKE